MTRYLLLFDSYVLVFVGSPPWSEDGSVFCICCWPSPAQYFSGPSPLGLVTTFYCLRFETSFSSPPTNSQGHGGGIRTRIHTGLLGFSYDSSILLFCRSAWELFNNLLHHGEGNELAVRRITIYILSLHCLTWGFIGVLMRIVTC
jgi:hypothetical protein